MVHTQHNADVIIKLIQKLGYRYASWQVFSDFLELAALSISNSIDWVQRSEREKKYLEIIGRYETKEQQLFPEMLGELVMAMDDAAATGGPENILGSVFHGLELHNKYTGQFFTPVSIADMMGQISFDKHDEIIREKGFITVLEPCAGSGTLMLGLAKAMKKKGYNYCSQMVVTAVDVDIKCVHMTYLQLALYGIPAVVIHGNTLSLEEWSVWKTPVYIMDGWWAQDVCGMTVQAVVAGAEKLNAELQPAGVIELKPSEKKKKVTSEQLGLFEEAS